MSNKWDILMSTHNFAMMKNIKANRHNNVYWMCTKVEMYSEIFFIKLTSIFGYS